MDADRLQAARTYLRSVSPAVCRWTDYATTIVWNEGPAITFRDELATVLARHERRGLPPLTAVLFLLSACRESWPEAESAIVRIVSEQGSLQRAFPDWIGEVMTSLRAIHSLPTAVRADLNARTELVDYVLEGLKDERTTLNAAAGVVQLLAAPLPTDWFDDDVRDTPPQYGLWRELGILRDCVRQFSPSVFLQRLRTTLDRDLPKANVQLPDLGGIRQLLFELRDDPELGGVAKIARQVLAAVALPLPVSQADELQLGGISDISNRGSLDQLLVSELAHDDLTLAVRIATRESLYVRREAPPRAPPRARLVVVDSGVRQWGAPRVFATAVALALAAAGNDRLEINTFRASGTDLTPIDLTTRDGLAQHLNMLEVDAHLGAALPAIQLHVGGSKMAADVVLVTSIEAAYDPVFMQALRAAAIVDAWLVAVDRRGALQLFRVGLREILLVREVKLDLAVLEAARPATATGAPLDAFDLPAYCKLHENPLRLPHPVSLESGWQIPGGEALALSKDRRLTYWEEYDLGPIDLASNMPATRVHWAGTLGGRRHEAVVGSLSTQGLHLLMIDLDQRSVQAVALELDSEHYPRVVCNLNDIIFVIATKHIVAFTRQGRRLRSTAVPPDLHHVTGPLFRDGNSRRWILPSGPSETSRWNVLSGFGYDDQVLWLAWPRGNEHELEGFTNDGCLLAFSTGHKERLMPSTLQGPFSLVAASRIEDRFLVQDNRTSLRYLVARSEESPVWTVQQSVYNVVDEGLSKIISRVPNIRRHFKGIAITREGTLVLLSSRDHELRVVPDGSSVALREVPGRMLKDSDFRPFQTVDAPGEYSLERADWPDGSAAWIDSRGLLHLRSSAESSQELTIVLCDGVTGSWSSDGRVSGPNYFRRDSTRVGRSHASALETFTCSLR